MNYQAFAVIALGALAGCQSAEAPPATSGAAAQSGFVGTWQSDWSGAIDTTLVVHSVSGNNAKVTYTWGPSPYYKPGSVNLTANVSGKTLSWSESDTTFTFTDRGGSLAAVRKTSARTDRTVFLRK